MPGTYNEKYTFEGQTRTITEWAELVGMHPSTLRSRLHRDIDIGEALTKPVREMRRRKHRKSKGNGKVPTQLLMVEVEDTEFEQLLLVISNLRGVAKVQHIAVNTLVGVHRG